MRIYRIVDKPRIVSAQISGANVLIQITTTSGETYSVDRTDNLTPGAWSNVTKNVAGTGGTLQITGSGAALLPKRF